MRDAILILDFGSQTTQLIARRVREAGVFCEIHPFSKAEAALAALAPRGVILSGGPASVYDEGAPGYPEALRGVEVPMLGICYGLQLLTVVHGGRVEGSAHREFGRAELRFEADAGGPFQGLREETVWMSHGDRLTALPEGFRPVATTANGVVAAMAHVSLPRYGVQFHPEVVHTPCGAVLLKRFVHDVCGLSTGWTMAAFVDEAVTALRARLGNSHVLCGLSGGVDSAVVAALLHRAIGPRLHCVLVDNGLLRHGEVEDVREAFAQSGAGALDLTVVDGADAFFSALEGVEDPEVKRKRIGHTFIELFETAARRIESTLGQKIEYLAQGTLYPDVVESVPVRGGPSVTIKSHHNVGGLPERLGFSLVEPLRELFKDEVRLLGAELGLPKVVVQRKPFPGPGLAVRVLGEVTREKVDIARRADRIVREVLTGSAVDDAIWQVFAVLLPVRTVGVMGDGRTYDRVVAVRAVSSTDGMTADFFPIPYDLLGLIATRIINEVKGVSRVVYDLSSKPPATIEWE